MFSNDSKVQIAVLQERFKAHEQIIEKVDTAIQKLSETNQNICKMLAVHDERLIQCTREDSELSKQVKDIGIELESLNKFRWYIGGALALSTILLGVINAFGPGKLLTPTPTPATIERTK
jgi:septal ring factor EnvC (AmiA/AmiB activator)